MLHGKTSSYSPWALALCSGALLALSFPKFGHPAFSWIALAPLLVALSTKPHLPLRRAFVLGLTTGVVYFSATLYWIEQVTAQYGGLTPLVATLVAALLVAYLALFPAFFAVIVRRLHLAYGPTALMAAPCAWVATELGRTHLFTGFPWVLLGYSQVTFLPIVQVASVLGVYGVSGLVASASAAAAFSVTTAPVRRRLLAGAMVAGLIAVTAGWGAARVANSSFTREGTAITVGLVQGNVSEAQRRDSAQAIRILQDHLRMTREAIAQGAGFVLWSESAMTPYRFADDPSAAGLVRQVAREARVPLLVGSDEIERGRPDKYYNSAFLVGADGRDAGVYRKMHLVPFGEYVPMARALFFVGPLVEAIGTGFESGVDPVVLPVAGHQVSVAICYEVVYPALVRQFVRRGSQLLTTITNDAWFGRTSAPEQHFAQASMRAIEEGRYLVRAANTGISGIVDPYGRVVTRSRIFEQRLIVGEARMLTVETAYARWGDVFAYASALATAVLVVAARRRVQ